MTATTRSSASVTVVSNIVSGRIIQKDTCNGVACLQVDLFDIDSRLDPEMGTDAAIMSAAAASISSPDVSALYASADRIGSAVTDESGRFEFNVGDRKSVV